MSNFLDEISGMTDQQEQLLDELGVTSADDLLDLIGAPKDTSPQEVSSGTALAMSFLPDVVKGELAPDTALTNIGKKKIDLIQAMNQEEPLNREQGVALGFLALLPVLIGAAVKGKRGAAVGAQASALGSTQFLKGIKTEQAKKQKRQAAQLKGLGQGS